MMVKYVEWVINCIQMVTLLLDHSKRVLKVEKDLIIGLVIIRFTVGTGWEGFLMDMVCISARIDMRVVFRMDLSLDLDNKCLVMGINTWV